MILPRLKMFLGRPLLACLLATFTAAFLLFLFCGLSLPALAVHEEWNQRWDGPTHQADAANKVAVDKNGNIYVAGYSDAASGYQDADYRLVKYAPDGTELWNRRYDGPAHSDDRITGLALDADGDAYVTGYSEGSVAEYAGSDYATLKYDPDGNRLWVRRYDGPAHGEDVATAIAVDTQGNAYVTGSSQGLIPDNIFASNDYATLKYAPDGTVLWTRRYDGLGHGYDFATALTVDAVGNTYVTGESDNEYALGNYTNEDIATIKYSPNGDQLWVSFYADDSVDVGNAIVVDSAGSVYVTGETYVGPYTEDGAYYITLKYDATGAELWSRTFQGHQYYSSASALAVDNTGNVLVTGNSGTLKYSPTGALQWVRDNQGKNNQGVSGAALAVDAEGCVYIAGNLKGSDANRNFSLTKYGPDGRLRWDRFFDGPTQGIDAANALALDAAGNVYITGYSIDANIDPTTTNMRTVKYSQMDSQ